LEPFDNSSDADFHELAKSQDLEERGYALMELAHSARKSENWVAARDHYGSALDVYLALGDEAQVASARYSLGFTEVRLKQFGDAVINLSLALERARSFNDSQEIAYICGPLADSLSELGRIDEALEIYELARGAYADLGENGPTGYAELRIGDLLMQQAKPATAREVFEAAYNHFQTEGDGFSAAFARQHLADALIELGLIDDAVRHLHDSLAVFEFLEADERVADSYLRLGIANNKRSRHSIARSHLEVAIRSFRKSDDYVRAAIAEIQHSSAVIFEDLGGSHSAAFSRSERAKQYLIAAGEQEAALEATVIMARSDQLNQRFSSAAATWKVVVEKARQFGLRRLEQSALTNLAECYLELGAFENGRKLLKAVDASAWGESHSEPENYRRVCDLAEGKPTVDEEPVFRCGNAIESWVELMKLPSLPTAV
jgi:tetratricopeptide (TPR) repeat protein